MMAQQQALRQQAQQAINGQGGSSNSNNTFSHQANPNDPSCTQGTMTVKSEKPEHLEQEDCDGPPPAKMMALTQNISENQQNQQNSQQSLSQNLTHETNPLMKMVQQSTHTSSGHSSESGSHRSSSSESHDLTKINIKSEALGGENSLNLSSLTMHHLLGLTQMGQNQDKTHAFSEKDTSGAESDGKVKSMDGFTAAEPDFSKIISDLKANEEAQFAQFGNAGDMEGKSSDAIFKDLINSLPM
jgi:hypothetical protein